MIKSNKYNLFLVTITILFIVCTSFKHGSLLSSDNRDGETIFRNIWASCHVRDGKVIQSGLKSLRFSDLEERGIANINSISEIANEGIGYMKGYKNKLGEGEDIIIAEWIIENSKIGWDVQFNK